MRIAIIALVIALAALGLAGFATFASLNDDDATPVAESGWSEQECAQAWDFAVGGDGEMGPLLKGCGRGPEYNCAPFNDMIQAINDNCP